MNEHFIRLLVHNNSLIIYKIINVTAEMSPRNPEGAIMYDALINSVIEIRK